MSPNISRRAFLKGLGAAGVAGAGLGVSPFRSPVSASSHNMVNIGVAAPLSGPFAFDGRLVLKGVQFAAKEINDAGGIQSLGGAKLNVVEADTGETTDSATTAAQDLISNYDLTAGIGSWLSSQTLGTTAVAERAGIPWLTLSFSDKIVQRGFKYVFQTSPMSSEFASQSLEATLNMAEAVGDKIRKVAMVGDNTAAIEFTFNPLREKFIPERGDLELVVDEVWTPTLSDATPIVRKLRQQKPDLMFFGAAAFPDSLAILRKMKELNVRLPTVGIGAWLAVPPYIKNIGVELTKGLMPVVGSHPLKGQEDIIRRFTQFADEPYMIQDSLSSFAEVHIIKEALERSGSSDPRAVRDAIASMTLTEGPAVDSFPVDRIRFMENGHMEGARIVITQWQDKRDADFIGTPAAPFTVFPEKYRMRDVQWPTRMYG